ncbi:MAG: hypothetical protein NTV22_02815 [bacterium]|nr:hypothetical protein [bacterium]
MKALPMFVLAATLAALASVTAFAVTEAWSYGDDIAAVYQILADGAGGCAMFGFSTNGQALVVWLDNKGAAKYTKRITIPAAVALPRPAKRNLCTATRPRSPLCLPMWTRTGPKRA